MFCKITFPTARFQEILVRLQREQTIRCSAGLNRTTEQLEVIVPGANPSELKHTLVLAYTSHFALPENLPPNCVGFLALGRGPLSGRAWGMIGLPPNPLRPVDCLHFVGPGMHTVALHHAALSGEESAEAAVFHSRSIGALGKEVWQRAVDLHYAIIGLGRTGSHLALSLSRFGARRLTLVDPDFVEPHGLGEMPGITPADLGQSKVQAVTQAIQPLGLSSPLITGVTDSVTHWPALQACQSCDVLFCCVDHDSARLAASAIATLFGKPLIDIATGIHGTGENRLMGLDVRLVLPGHCLLCLGGLRDREQAQQVLTSPLFEQRFYVSRHWQEERAGSLASLNQCAVGIALRLWEDLVAENVAQSTWTHLEFHGQGRIQLSYPPVFSGPCPLCRLSGWGEEGLSAVAQLFQEGWQRSMHPNS